MVSSVSATLFCLPLIPKQARGDFDFDVMRLFSFCKQCLIYLECSCSIFKLRLKTKSRKTSSKQPPTILIKNVILQRPTRTVTIDMILPAELFGEISPYPRVVIVTTVK